MPERIFRQRGRRYRVRMERLLVLVMSSDRRATRRDGGKRGVRGKATGSDRKGRRALVGGQLLTARGRRRNCSTVQQQRGRNGPIIIMIKRLGNNKQYNMLLKIKIIQSADPQKCKEHFTQIIGIIVIFSMVKIIRGQENV